MKNSSIALIAPFCLLAYVGMGAQAPLSTARAAENEEVDEFAQFEEQKNSSLESSESSGSSGDPSADLEKQFNEGAGVDANKSLDKESDKESHKDIEADVASQQPTPAVPPAPEPAVDSTDRELEQRLYSIYLKYQQTQIPETEWNSIVGSRSESFKVQKGSTLWDISHTLFGDGSYWPKVWSLNGSITNPHLIEPGQTIVFTSGDLSQAPRFALNEAPPNAETPPAPVYASAGEVDIPPPSRRRLPVLKDFPPSLPTPRAQQSLKEYDEIGFDPGFQPHLQTSRSFYVLEEIMDAVPAADGEVAEISGGLPARTAATFQYVVVKSKNKLSLGDRLVSYHVKPDSEPPVLQYEAELRVSDELDQENKLYRALIERSFDAVTIGSQVRLGSINKSDLNFSGPTATIEAKVVGGQFDATRRVAATGELIFLDKGSSEGLALGQVLSVVANRKARDLESRARSLGEAVALVRVVALHPHTATAMILAASSAVYISDFTGPRELFGAKDGEFKGRTEVELDQMDSLKSPQPTETTDGAASELDKEGDVAPSKTQSEDDLLDSEDGQSSGP